MQNKHVALETHGAFLPRPLQLNICWFRHGLSSVPRQSCCRGRWAAGQCCRERHQEGTLLLPRGSQPLRGMEQKPCLHPSILIIRILGLKNRRWGCFYPSSVFGLCSPARPASHQGNYWGFYHLEKGLFSPRMHMLPFWISLGAKGNVSVRVLGGGPCPQGPSTAEPPHSSQGSPGLWSVAAPKNARPKAQGASADFNSRGAEFGFSKIGRRRGNIHWVKKSIPLPPLPDAEKKIKNQAVFLKMQ